VPLGQGVSLQSLKGKTAPNKKKNAKANIDGFKLQILQTTTLLNPNTDFLDSKFEKWIILQIKY